MRIILWTIPAWVLAFQVGVRECSRNGSGENVRICGFKRKSSNLDRAPKMRDSVLLKSWDSFFVTLPSISWGTCAIYSSVIPGSGEFCDWLFLGYLYVSLVIAANFRYEYLFSVSDSQLSWTKLFNQACTVVYTNHYTNNSFIFPVYTFSLPAKHNFLHAKSR